MNKSRKINKKSAKKLCNGYIGTNSSCQYCKKTNGNHYHSLTNKTCKKYSNGSKNSSKKCLICSKHPKSLHYHK